MYPSQCDQTPKSIFAFVYYGPALKHEIVSGPPLFANKIKSCVHTDGMHYNIIHTSQPKRAVQVIQAFENYNAVVQTQEEKFFLKNLPYEPSVITFTKDAKPRDHVIGRHIEQNRKAAVNGDASTYTFWIIQNKRRADFEAEKRLRTIDFSATGEGGSMTNDVDVQALQDELVAKDATIAELEMRPTTEDMDDLRVQIISKKINVYGQARAAQQCQGAAADQDKPGCRWNAFAQHL